MAMLQVGMGTKVGTTGEPPSAIPNKLDQLIGGAKIWLTPTQVPIALSSLGAGWAASPLSVVGFLAVPALVLLLVLGMGAAKRRRARNPRRRRVYARRARRRANPRRKSQRGKYVVQPEGQSYGDLRTAERQARWYSRDFGRASVYSQDRGKTVSWFDHGVKRKRNPPASPTRRKTGVRRNPSLDRRIRSAQTMYKVWREQGQTRAAAALAAARAATRRRGNPKRRLR